jgi:hypothetical protein
MFAAVGLLSASCSSHSTKNSPPPSFGSAPSSTAVPTAVQSVAAPSEASATAPSEASAAASSTAAQLGAATPCGIASFGVQVVHVVWIWMENKPLSAVMGSSSAPYENALARQCGGAANYHGITHPSLPNYLAATGGSTFGVTDDGGPSTHRIASASIFSQLDNAGKSWHGYMESMPQNCATSASRPYAVKHNPAAYYTTLRASCARNDVPLEGNLQHDIDTGALPSFSFITPNLCNDTHDCPVSTGDHWLSEWIPRILDGSNYRSGDTVVVLTWDEGTGSNNQIPTVVVAPKVKPGMQVTSRLDHYGLLRGTEELLGLPPLGKAATATSFATAFGL